MKIQLTGKLLEELFRKENFAEITNILNNSPSDYRPFIIVSFFNNIGNLKPNQTEFALTLLNQAKAAFNKIDSYSEENFDFETMPNKFAALTWLFVKFGFYEEGIVNHGESIKSLNRILKISISAKGDKNLFPKLFSYSSFTNISLPRDTYFVNKYFDQIYGNISEIEDHANRLSERLSFLDKNLEKVTTFKLIPEIPGIPDSIPKWEPNKTKHKNSHP